MSFRRSYDLENKFVLTNISGSVNDKNLMEHVLKLNAEMEGNDDFRELADCLQTENIMDLTVQGSVHAAETERNRPKSKLAILVNESPLLFGMARAFQTFSEDRRKEVHIFHSTTEAIEWLASNENDLLKILTFLEKCQNSGLKENKN